MASRLCSGRPSRMAENTKKMDVERKTLDPRVQHAGKAGKHHTRALNVRKGRGQKPRKQEPKHLKWREE